MVDVDKLFVKTQESFDKRNYEYAMDLSRHILEVKPDHAGARQILRISTLKNYEIKGGVPSGIGMFLSSFIPMVKITFFSLFGKNSLQAINTCEAYLSKKPTSIWGRSKLANILKQLNYTDSAIQEYEGIISLSPQHILSLKSLGELYRAKQDIQKAMDYYKKVMSLNPADLDAPRALKDLAALTTIEKGGWGAAKSSRDIIRDKNKTVELEKSSQLTKSGDVDSEIKRLDAIIKQNPNDIQNMVSLKKLGELYIQKKDYRKAESTFQHAVKINPSDAMISMRLGDIKIMSYDADLSRLQKELTTNPANQSFKTQIEQLKSERRKFQIEEYKRRVQAHPTDMGLHFQLGLAFYSAGQIDEAIAAFQNSARDPKHRVSSYRYLGESFSKKKHYDLAVTQFKKALESGALSTEQTKDLRYLLARSYEDNNNRKEAYEEYKKILEIDFKYKDVAKKIENLK